MAERTRPDLNFTILCDDIRQELGGKISLMGIFEDIYASRFPAFHSRLAIVNEWSDTTGAFDAMLRILSPDRKTIIRETASKIKIADARQKQRDISIHLNIEFKEPGTYWIENYIDGVLVNSVPLNVILVKETSFQ
jgi:hypothetical protein